MRSGKQRAPLAKTDLVPTYFDGESRQLAIPRYYVREDCWAMKAQGDGGFVDHGRAFVIYRAIPRQAPSDGWLGQGSVISIARIRANSRLKGMVAPERLHYPIPACGAHNRPLHCRQVNCSAPVEGLTL